ncbi:MAG: DUF4169 family protein [Magnetovibrionaceae bacterium]
MAEVINLRQARKRKARADKAEQAEQNRIRFGRTKSEREALDKQKDRQRADLDGKKLDREPEN